MNAVLFPFTYMAENRAEAIFRRVGRFVIYQPIAGQSPPSLGKMASDGIIDLRCPVSGDESFLVRLCRSFQSWGAYHQGDAAQLRRLAESGFYNESFAADIRSEVLKGGEESSGAKPDPVVNARMFLQLAQEHDLRESEIASAIESLERTEKKLLDELHGEGALPADGRFIPSTPGRDIGEVMTGARVAAWAIIAREDADLPGVFLTDSQAVTEWISERFSRLARVCTVFSIPDPGDLSLADRVEQLVSTPWKEVEAATEFFPAADRRAADGFALEIFILPDVTPEAALQSLLGSPEPSERHQTGRLHTIFCRLKPTE